MRIKIKNPDTAAHKFTLIITAVLTLLVLAAAGAAAHFAGGLATAWNALGITIHALCQDDLTCNLGLSFIFKFFPFLILGIFGIALWEKRTKFSSRRYGPYFTHITFGADGVLLENSDKTKNLFFPYEKTSLDMNVSVHRVTVYDSRVTAVSKVSFAFTQAGAQSVSVKLLPPNRVMAFLCRILDKRSRFAQFSYQVVPLSPSYDMDAQILSQKLEKYCQMSFLASFGSNMDRLIFVAVGILFLLGVSYAAAVFGLQGPFSFVLYIVFFIGLLLVILPIKDAYLELKSRKK